MLTCKETSLLVSESYYRRLSWRERFGVRLHLVFCDACTHFRRQMDFLRRVISHFTQEQDEIQEEVTLSIQARERIVRKIEER